MRMGYRQAAAYVAWLGAGLLGGLASAAEPQVIEQGGYRITTGPPPEYVVPAEFPATWQATGPGQDDPAWRYWLVDDQVDRRGGGWRWYTDRAFEARTAALLSSAAQYQIRFDPGYQTLVLHRLELRREGAWQDRLNPSAISLARRETDLDVGVTTGDVTALLVIADVRPGDVVRVSFTIAGRNPVLAGVDHDELGFGWTAPILRRSGRVLFDVGAQPAVAALGAGPVPVRTRRPDAIEYRWEADGLAAVRAEDAVPSWYTPWPVVMAGERRRWEDVQDWARRLYSDPGPLPAELDARLAAWRALPDDDARAMAALAAVQAEVRYFSVALGEGSHRPTPPAETWARRYGDCKDKAWLLAVLLRALGMAADPAFVSTERGRLVAQALPAASQFDHVIVRATVGGTVVWLDPTRTHQAGKVSELVPADHGVALPVTGERRGLVAIAMPPLARDRTEVEERFVPSPDGMAMTLRVSSTYHGPAAERLRGRIASSGVDELGRQYLEYQQRRFGPATPGSPITVESVADTGGLRIIEQYTLTEPWSVRSGAERAIDANADAIEPFLALPATQSRAAPLGIAHPVSAEHVIAIELPPGWRWTGTGEAREVVDQAFRFRSETGLEGSTVITRQRYESTRDHVLPEGMPEHLRNRRLAAEAASGRTWLAVSPGASEAGRRDRLEDLMRGLLQGGPGAPAAPGADSRP